MLFSDISEAATWAIYFVPLGAAIVVAALLRGRPREAGRLMILAIAVSWVLALWALDTVRGHDGEAVGFDPHTWVEIFNLKVAFGIRLDGLTGIMLVVVTSVALLVQIYSTEYMRGDGGYARYYAYMGLFTSSMLGLVLASSLLQSSTAGRASAAQAGAAQAGIDEQRRQYEETQRLLAPYVSAGVPAVRQMQALSGALGPEAERAAIAQIEASPTLQAAVDRGETALLQRASATGGLRGGNIQAALAQFRPQMLSQEIQSRLGQFGGLATLGSNAAARQGTFGATTAGNIGNLLGVQGQAQAGGIIGETAPYASLLNIPLQLASLSASTGRPVF